MKKSILTIAIMVFALLLGNGMKAQQKAPQGAINGKFSVSADKQVYFSKGNLQYQPSTKKWRFAERQYNVVNADNYKGYTNSQYQGWIDLFFWGHGDNPLVGLDKACDNIDNNHYVDYGTNVISNGGNSKWRTPTIDEWKYLIFQRKTSSGIRFAKGKVNDEFGLILLPDDWSESYYHLNNTNNSEGDFLSNQISKADWTTLETKGAVFLPGHNGFVNYHDNCWSVLVDDGSSRFWSGDYWSSSSGHDWPHLMTCFII